MSSGAQAVGIFLAALPVGTLPLPPVMQPIMLYYSFFSENARAVQYFSSNSSSFMGRSKKYP